MLFEYKALQNGQKISGKMEAESDKEVADYLKANGYFPIEIKEKKTSSFEGLTSLIDRVSARDISFMTRQLSIMLDAGLTLIESLDIIYKQISKPPVKKMLSDIQKTIRDGKTFSQSLQPFPRQFSNFYIALVKSGEASGKLDEVLEKLAEHLEKQRVFNQKIKNALIYPTTIVIVMIAMIFVMFSFVMPKLLGLYENFNIELPASTQAIMKVSNFFETYWLYILLGMIGVTFGFMKFIKTERGKKLKDTYIVKIPMIGTIIKMAGLVDSTRTLSILMASGVPLLDGLSIVTEVNENIIFKQAFGRVSKKVEKGLSVGIAMSNEPIFPESLVQMAIVGEQTGHLDETLSKISEYYQSESEMAVKAMLSMLEPTILIVLGISVGFLVTSIITPIFTLTSSLQ
ncbi:MAG: type II secretion system F family protein [bacterium]|nr:type II secretion system F family protein [bacterium]